MPKPLIATAIAFVVTALALATCQVRSATGPVATATPTADTTTAQFPGIQLACTRLTIHKDKDGKVYAWRADNPLLSVDREGFIHIHCGPENFTAVVWRPDATPVPAKT